MLYVTTLHGNYDKIFGLKRRDFETMTVMPATRVPLVTAYDSPIQQRILFDYGPYLFQEMLRPRIGNERYHGALDLLATDFAGKAVTTEQVEPGSRGSPSATWATSSTFGSTAGSSPRRSC